MNQPIQIVVGSRNPVKIQCVRMGFEKMFPQVAYDLQAVDVPSGVSAQPEGSAEMLRGAHTRVEAARSLIPQADYWVGIEGGTEDDGMNMQAYAWVVVLSPHGVGKGRTGAFYLPKAIADLVRQGKELGEADDIFFGRSNSKQANGAIGLLTGDALNRTQYYEQAVMMALIPFKNPDLYQISAAG